MRKHCLLCNELTSGSISAAGNYWDRVCQTCRDIEDAAAALKVKHTARAMRFMFNRLLGQSEIETLTKEEKMEQFL